MDKNLKSLFDDRYHGAVNIRGIRFQILYSILRAFDLYEDTAIESIGLENIEDVDLFSAQLGNTYIQVKTSQNSWTWAKLKDPLRGFLKAYRVDQNCNFLLVVDFELKDKIKNLARFSSLKEEVKSSIKSDFRKRCRDLNTESEKIVATQDEADAILEKLTVISIPEEEIQKQLRIKITNHFGLGSNAVDIYAFALVGKFLKLAKDRQRIPVADLNNIRVEIGEKLTSEAEYQATARGYISRIESWQPDSAPDDFWDGKATRIGHIVSDVDVIRTFWLEKIDQALNASKVCVIRSSSGQGKSTLLYRYAFENWPAENTFIIKAAATLDHVAIVCKHLSFRASLGIPVYLLIDNANWETKYWPKITQECAAQGIKVLISIRIEDWYRFSLKSYTNYEIIEPFLSLSEAKDIFQQLQTNKRIHQDINSPEWAYEIIGEPHLLMEYIYLLTHGQMLKDRLEDQLKQFRELDEDSAKVEILRRCSLANALGAPVKASSLLKNLDLKDDRQDVLQSLSGEYLVFDENSNIRDLHRVRTKHIADILHEDDPNPAVTAMAIVEAVPAEYISRFVTNALCWDGLDVELFTSGIIDQSKDAPIEQILSFIAGIYEAGERHCFLANKELFDKAYKLNGPSGILFLLMAEAPLIRVNTIDEMVEKYGSNSGHFLELQEIKSSFKEISRGFDQCKDFLTKINSFLMAPKLQVNLSKTGLLLEWFALCGIELPVWDEIKHSLTNNAVLLTLDLDSFCDVTRGLYKYDEATYHTWFSQNKDVILGYLQLYTDSVKLDASEAALRIEFFPEDDTDTDINTQAVSRLRNLRSAIPFCQRYQSQGLWCLVDGLEPSVDDSFKNMPQENLHFEPDLIKNNIWRDLVQNHYLPDSYFAYEKFWFDLREDALRFVDGFSKYIQHLLQRKLFNYKAAFENGALIARLTRSLECIPDPPNQTPEILKKILDDSIPKWKRGLHDFIVDVFKYMQDKSNQKLGWSVFLNFNNASKNLQSSHDAFTELFKEAPDYFNVRELNAPEKKAYPLLQDLLEIWIFHPPRKPIRKISKHIISMRENKRRTILQQVKTIRPFLQQKDIEIFLPTDVYIDYPLHYIPLAFSVEDPDPISAIETLKVILEAILTIKDKADFFWLIPIHNSVRFIENGYRISSMTLNSLQSGEDVAWETFASQPIPEEIIKLLPPFPYKLDTVYHVVTIYSGLKLDAESFLNRINKIGTLKNSSNRFIVDLYNRHLEKAKTIGLSISERATNLRVFMQSEIPEEDQSDPVYKQMIEVLNKIEVAAQENTLYDFIKSGALDMVDEYQK